ncbi:hypothetical protein [uncultured Thomasclavelia sp.]|uniref:hypothetical protein n=1 Tax=uncultured Thomasclavelia sp. TaxID=3025759 RepID=UPI0025F3F0F9|nr:hypothetical protein [uncultured Thomasclavelia sp.]
MIKKLQIICLIIAILFIPLSIYGKYSILHLSYLDYYQTAFYNIYYSDDIKNQYPYLSELIIEDISNYQDLFNNSPYVLVVTINDIEIIGEGIINKCTVDKVIKGKKLQQDNKINIYDHAFVFSQYAGTYFEGAIPLQIDKQYIIFIDKAPNPNISNSYIFKSIKYGSFKIDNQSNYYLLNDENMTLKQISNYDYVSKNNADIIKYEQLYQEIKEKLLSTSDIN